MYRSARARTAHGGFPTSRVSSETRGLTRGFALFKSRDSGTVSPHATRQTPHMRCHICVHISRGPRPVDYIRLWISCMQYGLRSACKMSNDIVIHLRSPCNIRYPSRPIHCADPLLVTVTRTPPLYRETPEAPRHGPTPQPAPTRRTCARTSFCPTAEAARPPQPSASYP